MEFLIPTLRVAKSLEWTGHELSHRLMELEQLDEFRLQSIAGMYAQKRRMKKFHDAHIISKDFQKGDLVLVYSLKKHTLKLKKRGIGPFVIHELSNSGAVHLSTLDGELMPNWISGCRLKKYHEPLTMDILERIHAAKTRKQQRENKRAFAIQEAKERAAKIRKQRAFGKMDTLDNPKKLRINTMLDKDGEIGNLRPFVLIHVGSNKIQRYALVDSGADINSISYEVWEKLQKPVLTPSKTTVATFIGNQAGVEGYLELALFLNETNVQGKFFVMKPGQLTTPVVLGQPWMRTYNGVPKWKKEGLTFEVDNNKQFIPFLGQEYYSSDDEKNLENQEQPQEQGSSSSSNVPPKEVTPVPRVAQEKKQTSLGPRQMKKQQIWIPATLKQAQEGSNKIWIPRSLCPPRAA